MVYRNRILPTGGEQGPQGPPGADGADGSVWHWVTATPDGSLGKVGDWATRTDTGATWQKTGASTWTSRGSLRGPQGIQGIQGPQGATGPKGDQGIQGPTGATGPKGNVGDRGVSVWSGEGHPSTWAPPEATELDTYIDTLSGDVYVVSTGSWSYVLKGNIRGPQGPQGPQGEQGPEGEYGAQWLDYSNLPDPSVIRDRDQALDPTTGDVYIRFLGSWVKYGNIKGPQGATGPQGTKGDTGATGPTGPAGTITGATATGLAAGASPTVTLGGTPSARTFAFGIPQGAKGDKGDKGDAGATGPKGDTGDTGPAGTAATVSVGTTTTGAPGTNAAVTQSGTSANRTFNFTIPRGDKGEKGEKGETGGAGVLGGAKFVHPLAQSIPHAQWTAIGSAGSSMTSIVPGTVSGSTGTAGSRMVVNSAGWWMVGASIGYGNAGTTGGRYLMVETWTGTDPGVGNAANTRIIYQQNNNPSSATTFNVSTVVQLAANTNVRLCAYQTSGSALSTSTAFPTELWLTRVL